MHKSKMCIKISWWKPSYCQIVHFPERFISLVHRPHSALSLLLNNINPEFLHNRPALSTSILQHWIQELETYNKSSQTAYSLRSLFCTFGSIYQILNTTANSTREIVQKSHQQGQTRANGARHPVKTTATDAHRWSLYLYRSGIHWWDGWEVEEHFFATLTAQKASQHNSAFTSSYTQIYTLVTEATEHDIQPSLQRAKLKTYSSPVQTGQGRNYFHLASSGNVICNRLSQWLYSRPVQPCHWFLPRMRVDIYYWLKLHIVFQWTLKSSDNFIIVWIKMSVSDASHVTLGKALYSPCSKWA